MGIKNMYSANLSEVMKEIYQATGTNQNQLAVAMGYTQGAGVANIVKNEEIKITTMIRWADSLEYDLVLRPKNQHIEGEVKFTVKEDTSQNSSKIKKAPLETDEAKPSRKRMPLNTEKAPPKENSSKKPDIDLDELLSTDKPSRKRLPLK